MVVSAAAASSAAGSSGRPRNASAAAAAMAKLPRWKRPAARSGQADVEARRTSSTLRSETIRSATARDSWSSSAVTRIPWSRTTASFSSAMSFSVGPSQRVCSRPTDVSTCTFDGITFVASKRPPSPASITTTSTPRRASSW